MSVIFRLQCIRMSEGVVSLVNQLRDDLKTNPESKILNGTYHGCELSSPNF